MSSRLRRKPIRQRARDLWDQFRLVIRSPIPWAIVATWLLATGSWGWAIAPAVMAGVGLIFESRIREFHMRLDHEFRTDSEEFLSTIAGISGAPLVGGNHVTIYNNGDEFYPAMLNAIANARHSVTMEQYIFSSGKVGQQFVDAFAERARAGVTVKLLVDAVGGSGVNGDMIELLQESGCEIRFFHPIRWYSLHRVNNRTHRKSIIIDGRIAFTGGAGIDDHWQGGACSPEEWRDLQIRIEGPGVIPLQSGFATNWIRTTGEVITGPRFYPALETTGGVEVQTVLSSPKADQYSASILYQLVLQAARKSIWITNPYFIPPPRTVELLAEAVERGVTVRVLMSGSHCDTWIARMNSVRLYGRLLDAGVELYEYKPTMLHQKTMIVDEIWATVGTANFDNRSFQFNEESTVCFYDPELVYRLREIFEEDLLHAERIQAATWSKRSALRKYGELFAALVKDQV